MYVIIIGGGKVGYYLTKLLLSQGHEVMLIENDRAKFASLANELGDSILLGDGSTMETLKEAGANRADVIVAVTGHDEDNLVACQLAKMLFIRPRTIARVNNPVNEDVFSGLGSDITISATKLLNAIIQEQVKAEDMVIPLLSLRGGDVEIMEIEISSSSPVANKMIKDLPLPKGSLFVSILRGDEVLVPRGDVQIREDDQVIVLVKKVHAAVLRQILIGQKTKNHQV